MMYRRCLFVGLLLAAMTTIGCSDDTPPADDAGLSDAADIADASDAADTISDAVDASDDAADATGDAADSDAADAPDTDGGSDASSPGPQTGAEAASAYEQAALAFIETYCEAASDCRHRTEDDDVLANHLTRYDTVADCKADADALLVLIGADQLKAAIAAGTVAFDASKAQECQASLYTNVCDRREYDGICDEALVGQIASGGGCSAGAECSDGLSCMFDDACSGTCEPLNPPTCGDQTCSADEYCDDASTKCEPLKAAGDACDDNVECGGDTTCNYDGSTNSGECVAPESLPEGAYCQRGWSLCQPHLRCDEASSACVAGAQPGESCTHSEDCDTSQDVRCNGQTDTCEMLGSLTEGQACDRDALCEPALTCDPRTDLCADTLAAGGESCSFPFMRCEQGRCQDMNPSTGQGTCGPLRQEGEACMATLQCALGLFCEQSSGTCAAVKADGETCSRALECASLRCLEDGTCGSGSSCVE